MGFSPSTIGIIVSAQNLLTIPLAIPLGRLLDKLSPVYGITIGFFLNFISSILLMVTKNFWGILLSQLISGVGFLFIIVGAQAAISKFNDFSKKADAFAKLSLSGAIGQSVGPYLGGLVVHYFDFFTLFTLSLVLSIPGMFFVSSPKQKKSSKKQEKGHLTTKENLILLLKSRTMILILTFTGLSVFVATLRTSFFPIYLKQLNFTPDIIGMLISLFSIVMSIIRIFISKFFKKIWFSRLIIVTMTFFSIGLFLIPITSNFILISMGVILWGIGFGISQPLSMLIISENIPKSISGLGMGIRFTAITTSAFIAPIIFGIIAQYFKLSYIFYFTSFLCIMFNFYYIFTKLKHNLQI